MKRTPVTVTAADYPAGLHPYLDRAVTYDSSCSPEARVIYLEKDGGYYLKTAPLGTLCREAEMTRYFFGKGLGAEVLEYISDGVRDYLLTARVRGEDCTHEVYLSEPKRLAALLGERLRMLHDTDFSGCPVMRRMDHYFETAAENYKKGEWDLSYLPKRLCGMTADEAFACVETHKNLLKNDTLLHGDYCLPNVMLEDWRFSGFIDLGNGGVGDRHVDLFWGAWTLKFNLKTEKYRERFFDAYGRDGFEPDLLDVIGAAEVFG